MMKSIICMFMVCLTCTYGYERRSVRNMCTENIWVPINLTIITNMTGNLRRGDGIQSEAFSENLQTKAENVSVDIHSCCKGFEANSFGECKKCKDNSYGYKCSHQCRCTQNQKCDHVTGCREKTSSDNPIETLPLTTIAANKMSSLFTKFPSTTVIMNATVNVQDNPIETLPLKTAAPNQRRSSLSTKFPRSTVIMNATVKVQGVEEALNSRNSLIVPVVVVAIIVVICLVACVAARERIHRRILERKRNLTYTSTNLVDKRESNEPDYSEITTRNNHIPTSRNNHIPTSRNNHIPTSTNNHIPTSTNNHIPTSTNNHLPTSTNNVVVNSTIIYVNHVSVPAENRNTTQHGRDSTISAHYIEILDI